MFLNVFKAACVNGLCELQCIRNVECPDGLVCDNSRCVPCTENSDCTEVRISGNA